MVKRLCIKRNKYTLLLDPDKRIENVTIEITTCIDKTIVGDTNAEVYHI